MMRHDSRHPKALAWLPNIARLMVYPGCKLTSAPFSNLSKAWNSDISVDPGFAYGVMSSGAWFGWSLYQVGASIVMALMQFVTDDINLVYLCVQWIVLSLPIATLVVVVPYCNKKEKELLRIEPEEVQSRWGGKPVWEVNIIANKNLLFRQSIIAYGLAVALGLIGAVINPFNQ